MAFVNARFWHQGRYDYVHPDCNNHKDMWLKRGHTVVDDPDCQWSDGNIGGFCCEMYSRGVEIGNLVNTLGHSTDVGFGWERLHMIVEGVERVDQTSLFGKHHPVVADHIRALEVMWRNNITPGSKGRNYVCQRLLRRIIPLLDGTEKFVFDEWLEQQKQKRMVTVKYVLKYLKTPRQIASMMICCSFVSRGNKCYTIQEGVSYD